MTEVLKNSTVSFSNNFPSDRPVLSVKHYEATPPANLSTQIVDPENVLATTKEEEWVTKKKTEVTTKKQIETRVKRQVVLEDGKVVEDSGPIVTTNTTEDTEKQEHEQTEHRQIGDDAPGEGWVAVPNASGLVKEVRENKVKSREETEELLETEDVQHLGDITDEAYLKAIQSQRKDLRLALRQASSELLSPSVPNGRIVHQSKKNRKVIDSENTKHSSEVQNDGRLITETTKTTEHEELNNTAEPDDDDDDDEYETHHESSQRFRKTKDQELVEYLSNGVKIGEEMRFEAENVEGDRHGDPDSLKMDSIEWESLSERIRRMRREKQQKLEEAERMDALTKKPLNFDQEEETRKVETSKWLEHHFGSESRSSRSSIDDEDHHQPKKKTSTSFINVTMKSTKAHEQNAHGAPSSQQHTNAFYKGISEWNGNSSRHSLANGFHKVKPEPKSPPLAKKNVYDVQNGSIKRVASEERSRSAFQPVNERTKSLSSKYYTEHTSSPISSPISELESSPLYASIQQKYNDKTSSSYDVSSNSQYAEKTNVLNGKSTPNGILRATSPTNQYKSYNGVPKTENNRPERKSSMVKREYMNKSWSRSERRLTDISDSDIQREPDPDYSPRLRRKVPSSPDVRSSPTSDTMRKKIYQKTRFSAEIPMIKRAKPTTPNHHRPAERKSSSLGDTFRKIIGKFQGNSADRKRKSQHRSGSSNGVDSISNGGGGGVPHSARNQNSHYSSYQAFNSVDNHITDNDTPDVGDTDRSGRDSPLQPKQAVKYASFEEPLMTGATTTSSTMTKKRVTTAASSPPSARRSSLTNGSQTLDRNYRAKKRHDDNMSKRSSPAQKYYLGEDPFSGSIYGKEKEYDGAKPFRRKYKNGNSTDEEKKSVKSHILNGVNNILGGRLSKSTGKLASDSNHRARRVPIDYTDRGVQTLPRKSKKQVFINDPHSDQENLHSRRSLNNHNSNSMINVSVVNNRSPSFKSTNGGGAGSEMLGPQKPARTYRSSLLRSKSFNVHLGPTYGYDNSFKSNPQLHKLDKLDESPPPLKSPSIVTSISRSTRDLSKSFDDDYRSEFAKSNGYSYDSSRRTFLKGLKSRAPELYKTLHEDDEFESSRRSPSRLIPSSSTPLRNKSKVEYSNSFHSGNTRKPTVSFESDRYSPQLNKSYTTLSRPSPDRNGDVVNKTVSRNGSNDDYSETVRYTSKSTDPLRPSVTDTVQSFSKKTVPSKDGRMETIESSETTRVTKSHYRGDGENDRLSNKYNSKNGSTVIELRNARK